MPWSLLSSGRQPGPHAGSQETQHRENHLGWWQRRAGLLCTEPTHCLVTPSTWLNAKDARFTWLFRKKAMVWDCPFFQHSEEYTKILFPAPSYWDWNLIARVTALYGILMCMTTVGAQVPLRVSASAGLPSLPQNASCLPVLGLHCHLSHSWAFGHHLGPSSNPSAGIAIYYLALSIISRRCFSKWINAEHWVNGLRMAPKLHESGLILGWSSRSKFRNCES